MSNVWDTVSIVVHLPGMFPLADFLFKKGIGLVTMDLLYIIFTYYTQVNQQLILLVRFGAFGYSLASCVVVQV